MLNLRRDPGEEIIIGDDITIMVTRVRGHHVTLGVTAPKGVPVHRREVYEIIKAEEREAAREGDA